MFEITPAASTRIREFMSGRQPEPIRIHVKPSITDGPSLAMRFDTQTDGDSVYVVDGLTYLVDRKLLEEIHPIRIDRDAIGLRFSSRLNADDEGCGCGCGGH
ncbi:MAG: HesB-like (seleno)protein [Pseudomonadota bacterium]